MKRFIKRLHCKTPNNKTRGGVIELAYNPILTQFNINDYIKQSKKSRRSEKLEVKKNQYYNNNGW